VSTDEPKPGEPDEPSVAIEPAIGPSVAIEPAIEPTEPSVAEPAAPPAPTTATIDDLRAAVGVTPKPTPTPTPTPPPAKLGRDPEARDDLEDELPLRRRKWPIAVGLSAVLGATVATFVLLGRANEDHYYLRCTARHVTAERGRSFPPWGSERLEGAAWKPISIPPSAECTPRETDDPVALEGWYLDALVEQATSKLAGASPGDIDVAQAELEQAMLLTRSPERRDQRKELERLLGDVTYWRAAAKVKAAAASLEEAATRFDEAVSKRPRHASDAGAWATLARDTAATLGAGPGGAGAPKVPPSGVPLPGGREPAPPGVALPVDVPFVGTPDAGVPEEQPDAARSTLPSGGVLL
jgi:hypothetical protein